MKGQAKPKIVVVCGATGVGKTTVAISLAERFRGEVVGADALQVYRFMDIGTAKPTVAEQTRAVHHMIDIVDPDEDFDAQKYRARARPIIENLVARGCLPLVVGGTGFYIKALIHGLFESLPVSRQVRQRLKKEAALRGSPALHQRLAQCDPEAAARIHPNDTYRVTRALEVFEASGKTISDHQQAHAFKEPAFDALQIGLDMERRALYRRIDRRVDLMIEQGLLAEVQKLLHRGYTVDLKAMQSLGYRHMAAFLQGQLTWEEAVRTLKRDTRRYAKRQLTWFQADSQVMWVEHDDIEKMADLIEDFLKA